MSAEKPRVLVVQGSPSDDEPMAGCCKTLEALEIPYVRRVLSAHRTPEWMVEYAQTAEDRGLQVIIAGAGGAAHLPGMVAGHTLLPVVGVPVQSSALSGMDSLLSIVQMPAGVPVATMAIGKAGAINAALYAIAILGVTRPALRDALADFRRVRAEQVMGARLEFEGSQ